MSTPSRVPPVGTGAIVGGAGSLRAGRRGPPAGRRSRRTCEALSSRSDRLARSRPCSRRMRTPHRPQASVGIESPLGRLNDAVRAPRAARDARGRNGPAHRLHNRQELARRPESDAETDDDNHDDRDNEQQRDGLKETTAGSAPKAVPAPSRTSGRASRARRSVASGHHRSSWPGPASSGWPQASWWEQGFNSSVPTPPESALIADGLTLLKLVSGMGTWHC